MKFTTAASKNATFTKSTNITTRTRTTSGVTHQLCLLNISFKKTIQCYVLFLSKFNPKKIRETWKTKVVVGMVKRKLNIALYCIISQSNPKSLFAATYHLPGGDTMATAF